jgi:hypothetical protein
LHGVGTHAAPSRRRLTGAVLALAAGAALVVSGCGGVLGTAVSPTVAAIVPVNCAIGNAVAENQNYGNAVYFKSNSLPFAGAKEDDLTRPANRLRIFRQRLAELKRQEPAIRKLDPESDLDEQFVAAAKGDLAKAEALSRFNLRWAPGDPKSPTTDLPVPDALDGLISNASASVKQQFDSCEIPPDLVRRSQEYG